MVAPQISDGEAPPVLPAVSGSDRPSCPASPATLCAQPELIKDFSVHYGISFRELAGALSISPSALTRYGRRQRPLPETIAAQIIAIWRAKEHS